MNLFISIALFALLLTFYFGFIRNQAVYLIRMYFINTDSSYPIAFRALPSYDAMLYHPRYQLLWTKAQWLKWVKAQGVAV